MEELLKKAKELKIEVKEGITEEELKKIIEEKEKELAAAAAAAAASAAAVEAKKLEEAKEEAEKKVEELEKQVTELEELKKQSRTIETQEEIAQVGAVSSGDNEIGKLIAQAMEVVGKEGVITVEESKTMNTELETVEGMQFDRGFVSAYMVTDVDKMEAVLNDPYILITDKKISNIQELLPILNKIVEQGKKLLIIAEDVEGEALSTLVLNKLRGVCEIVAVKAPGFGDRRKEMLQDIAILTGGVVISEEVGYDLKECDLDMLGRASSIKVVKDSTTIVGGFGEKEEIQNKTKQIGNNQPINNNSKLKSNRVELPPREHDNDHVADAKDLFNNVKEKSKEAIDEISENHKKNTATSAINNNVPKTNENKCPKCGSVVDNSFIFCDKCGYKLK